MAAVYMFTVAIVTLGLMPGHVTGQDQCPQAAQTTMQTCAQGASISMPNYLWFVSNGTSPNGQAPADEAAFKTQICSAQSQIGNCIFSQMGTLANTTCQTRQDVMQTLQKFLMTYDTKCAHPCRFTIVDDLRKCYVSSGLSADLFLSNKSASHVIGSNKEEVGKFCSQKDALMGCIKPLHSNCPDAVPILGRQNFDLTSYEKGVMILCSHPDVYLQGLSCFEESTAQVDACAQKSQQAMVQISMEAQSKQWNQAQFEAASCPITMEQVSCDLKAWEGINREACTKTVVDLRREVECNLMPPNCTTSQKAVFDQICNPALFDSGNRNAVASQSGVPDGASSVVSLPLALLFAALLAVVKNAVV